jgi:hypothetical protein
MLKILSKKSQQRTSCIQDRNNWKLYVEKAKNSTIEVEAPKEEEDSG